MRTPIYFKMDAPEQLLLSEGVCRQLGIITYHTEVQPVERGKADKPTKISKTAKDGNCVVPTVRVRLVKDVRILPNESLTTQIKLKGEMPISTQPMIVEADPALLQDGKCRWLMWCYNLCMYQGWYCKVSLVNRLELTQKIEGGMDISSTQSACPERKGQLQIRWGL